VRCCQRLIRGYAVLILAYSAKKRAKVLHFFGTCKFFFNFSTKTKFFLNVSDFFCIFAGDMNGKSKILLIIGFVVLAAGAAMTFFEATKDFANYVLIAGALVVIVRGFSH